MKQTAMLVWPTWQGTEGGLQPTTANSQQGIEDLSPTGLKELNPDNRYISEHTSGSFSIWAFGWNLSPAVTVTAVFWETLKQRTQAGWVYIPDPQNLRDDRYVFFKALNFGVSIIQQEITKTTLNY